MLTVEKWWPVFLENAKVYEQNAEVFYSIKHRNGYQIISTINDVVKIQRLKTGTFVRIGKGEFSTCLLNINNTNNLKFLKESIYKNVAEEATIVELLPMLSWSDDGKYIYNSAYRIDLDESVDSGEEWYDDLHDTTNRDIINRPWQQKLKIKLLELYNGKCAITGCNIEETLQACHITPFAKQGNSISVNGLLLRADIHSLFDAHLISINPQTFTIHTHPKLKGNYDQYDKKILSPRNDNRQPNYQGLNDHWDQFNKK